MKINRKFNFIHIVAFSLVLMAVNSQAMETLEETEGPYTKITKGSGNYAKFFLGSFKHKNLDALKAFISKDAFPLVGNKQMGLAVRKKVSPNAEMVLEESKGEPRFTLPLHYAIENGWFDGVKLILEEGGDVNLRNSAGQTPLLSATFSNVNPKIVELLLEYGADPEAKSTPGEFLSEKTVLDFLKNRYFNQNRANVQKSIELIEKAIEDKKARPMDIPGMMWHSRGK